MTPQRARRGGARAPSPQRDSGGPSTPLRHIGSGGVLARNVAAVAALLALALLWRGSARAADDPSLALARERGCLVCHAVGGGPAPVASALPTAPSFHDIARRYHGKPGAADQLARTVVQGTPGEQGRHWRNEAAASQMFPNDLIVTDAEARQLVTWILALDSPARAGRAK